MSEENIGKRCEKLQRLLVLLSFRSCKAGLEDTPKIGISSRRDSRSSEEKEGGKFSL